MKLFNIVTFLVVMQIMTSCDDESEETLGFQLGRKIAIDFGRTLVMQSEGLSLEFHTVQEDSRCPDKTDCVTEGIAVIGLTLSVGSQEENFHLATRQYDEIFKTASYFGYTVELKDLKPYPEAGRTRPDTDYHATVLVTEN